MLGQIGVVELALLLGLGIIIFAGKKLPLMGRYLGRAIKELKKESRK